MLNRNSICLCVAIFVSLAFLAEAKEPEVILRSETKHGESAVRIYAPEKDAKLDFDATLPLEIEYVFPENTSAPTLALDFDDIPFDCDELPTTVSDTTENGLRTRRLHYDLIPVQSPFKLPELPVTFQTSADNETVTENTSPISFNIQESKDAAEEDIDDSFLTPENLPLNRKELLKRLAWIGASLLVAILLGGSIWRTLRDRARKANPPLTPYQIAERDLNALLAEQLPEAGQFKLFYERISAILRQYLENRFAVKAPRLTTEEFLQLLTSTPELVREHRELLQKFLTACDLVKFAAQVPQSPEITDITSSCRNFLEATQSPPPTIE